MYARLWPVGVFLALACVVIFKQYYSIGSSVSKGPVIAAASMLTSAEPEKDTNAVVVYVTVPSMEVGEKLAGGLVESKLAACVNIVPGITSVYWWDGKVNKDPELMLIIKTRRSLLDSLTTYVKGNHPYDECEVIALPIMGGSPSYIKWVIDSTQAAAGQQ